MWAHDGSAQKHSLLGNNIQPGGRDTSRTSDNWRKTGHHQLGAVVSL